MAIGASDTVGVGADDPDTEGWVAVLHQRLPEGTILHRLGISGSLARDAIVEQVPQAETIPADIVTIWLVINDFRAGVTLEEFIRDLSEIVRRMCATGAAVLVGNMPVITSMPEFEATPTEELERLTAEWNAAIARVASDHGAVLVDLLAASEGMGEDTSMLLSEDRFHPSTLGHLALAEIFYHFLEEHQAASAPKIA